MLVPYACFLVVVVVVVACYACFVSSFTDPGQAREGPSRRVAQIPRAFVCATESLLPNGAGIPSRRYTFPWWVAADFSEIQACGRACPISGGPRSPCQSNDQRIHAPRARPHPAPADLQKPWEIFVFLHAPPRGGRYNTCQNVIILWKPL